MANEAREFKELADDFGEEIGDLMIDLTLKLHENLHKDTPKKTGLAANNWFVSSGTPILDSVGYYSVNLNGVSFNNASTAKAFSDGQLNSIKSYTLDKGNIFIANNLPYILALDGGSSTKAPKNFVTTAIRKAIVATEGVTFK